MAGRRRCSLFSNGASLRRPEVSHCALAGEALAKFHAAGAGFAIERANSLGPAAWEKLARDDAEDNADSVQSGLAELLPDARA